MRCKGKFCPFMTKSKAVNNTTQYRINSLYRDMVVTETVFEELCLEENCAAYDEETESCVMLKK